MHTAKPAKGAGIAWLACAQRLTAHRHAVASWRAAWQRLPPLIWVNSRAGLAYLLEPLQAD